MARPRTGTYELGQRDDTIVAAVITGLALPKLTPEISLTAPEPTAPALTVWKDWLEV
jgi:hypothetical protein